MAQTPNIFNQLRSFLIERWEQGQEWIQKFHEDSPDIAQLPQWIIPFLQIAAYYNFVWGVAIFMYPLLFLQFFNVEAQTAPPSLRLLAVGVFVLGIIFFLVSIAPFRLFVALLLGILAKISGIVLALSIANEQTNAEVLWLHILINDLVWIPPLCLTFYLIFKQWQNTEEDFFVPFPYILYNFDTNKGNRLANITQQKPTLLIFLRHFGCTFCKEALAELAQKRQELEQQAYLVLVHMATETEADAYFEKFGLQNIAHISDPSCGLYRAFDLQRGNITQVFGWQVWVRGFKAAILKKHGIGKLVGDGFRMPGVFLIYQNQILQEFRHKSVADKPNYTELASCPI